MPGRGCRVATPNLDDANAQRIQLAIRESLDEPPKVVAYHPSAPGSQKVLFDPNPELKAISFGEVRVLRWRSGSHELIGGLYLPPDFKPEQQYPLVIQGHGFNPERFLPTGLYETGFAARALAARNIVVFQIADPCNYWYAPRCTTIQTPQEAEDNAHAYVTAIDLLAEKRLIDRRKVGILGFSRTGMYVLHVLARSPEKFAAAALYEAARAYGNYFIEVDSRRNAPEQMAAAFGQNPIGVGLKKWIDNDPSFHLDRITTPILFESGNPADLIATWPLYAGLKVARKPVDLLYIRDGRHVLVKPHQRLTLQEMTVDWFDFWLNGQEDPDASKRAQYDRWRQLRKEHEAELQKPIPPWLIWTPNPLGEPAH
jgi:dipeptidyl aminopeptidase/acylaminoacyl peptidase